VSANTSAINNANPTASWINPLRFPCPPINGGDVSLTPRQALLGRRHVTGRATRVPGAGATDPSDRSGDLVATVRAHLVRVRRWIGDERATRVSRCRRELDAAQGMHGPGDTGPGAVMGVVVACAAQVPRSPPADDHTSHDDRLRVAGLPYGSLTRRVPPNERTNSGTPTPLASVRRADPNTVVLPAD
jgi:hypothetical protein